MKVLLISVALILVGLPLAGPASAEDAPHDPVELVRTLRAVQDKIVQGSRGAHAAHRKVMAAVADRLMKIEPERWRDPRYLRAGILFTLSGGETRVARHVLGLGDLPAPEERLMKGALAYAEGRNTEASELIAGVDARTLDSSIAGHVALAQGVLLAKDEPKRAMTHLEMARLLSPGTLVEEAALRREILLLASIEDADRFETLTARYMRRYRKSVYAQSFRRQLATEIARMKSWDDAQRLARLEGMLEGLDTSEKRELYLVMAQVGILKGHIGLTRFAARHARNHDSDGVSANPQARVYEAAALIVTDEFENGLAQLQRIDRDTLAPRDAELLDAAFVVAGQIRRWPEPGLVMPTSPPPVEGVSARARDLAQVGVRVAELAQAMMTKVDAILNTRSR